MDTSAGRQFLLADLLAAFRNTFPKIRYQIFTELNLLNGQALVWRTQRIVQLYGGLALHPKLGSDGLTFIILHEVGHHLASGCRSKRDPSLACECASDHWAVTAGIDTLLQKSGRSLRLEAALEQLDQVHGPRQPRKAGYTKKAATSGCWAKGWSLRSRRLLEGAQPPTIEGHCITYV